MTVPPDGTRDADLTLLQRAIAEAEIDTAGAREVAAAIERVLAALAAAEQGHRACGESLISVSDKLEQVQQARDELRERVDQLEKALGRIRFNATSWHGPEGEGTGHARALAVIATWAEEALSATREDAKLREARKILMAYKTAGVGTGDSWDKRADDWLSAAGEDVDG
jgi:hypothetical protein